jgi:hypothetical protein
MPKEYTTFLRERGLAEADVYPLTIDRGIFLDQRYLQRFAEFLFAVAQAGAQEDVDRAQALIEGMSPAANANFLVRSLDRLLRQHFARAGLAVPDGVLTTGVFPLDSFSGRAVPRQHGVLLLLDTGSLEFLEFCVSLDHMQNPSADQRASRLADAVRAFCQTRQFPSSASLDDIEWRRVKISILHGVNWAEWFVLGHEYAHHALGHLRTANREAHAANRHTFDVVKHTQVAEYEADLWSLCSLIRIADAGAPPSPHAEAFAYVAPFYFLGVLALIERFRAAGGPASQHHPPAVTRIMNLELFLKWWGYNRDGYIWGRLDELFEKTSKALFGTGLEIPATDKRLQKDLAQIIVRTCAAMPRRGSG